MAKTTLDEWPDETPPGHFEIYECRLQGRTATHRIMFRCPNWRTCNVIMAPRPEARRTKEDLYIWGWDGNADRPTLTPSINCRTHDDDGKPGGGCGWHGHIQNGVMIP